MARACACCRERCPYPSNRSPVTAVWFHVRPSVAVFRANGNREIGLAMIPSSEVLFSSDLWQPALEKYARAAHLTVNLFDSELRVIGGPIHPTPLFQLFDER